MDAPGEQYNLKWNSYTNNLIQVLSEHQQHENLVDITLCCEGQFIKAHKLVLSACSEFFQNMFKYHNVPHPIVIFNGVKLNHLKHILEFMYQGEVKVLDVDLEGVLLLGKNLQVKGLSSVKYTHKVPSEPVKTNLDKQQPIFNEVQEEQNLTPVRENVPALKEQNFSNFINNTQPVSKSVNNAQPKLNEFHSTSRSQTRDGRIFKQKDTHVEEFLGGRKVETRVIPKIDQINRKSRLENRFINPPEPVQRKSIKSDVPSSSAASEGTNVKHKTNDSLQVSDQNSRPANAFMLFANEWRKKLEVEYPDENNKSISVRLGDMWKSLSNDSKQTYYNMEMERKTKSAKSASEESKPKKLARRRTIDSISYLAAANLQEVEEDDDLQIVHAEFPKTPQRFRSKRLSEKFKNN